MFAKVVFPKPPDGEFDYAVPVSINLSVGSRVNVPFGSTSRLGYVVDVGKKEPHLKHQLKEVISSVDETPVIDEKALAFANALSEHYFVSVGAVLNLIYPIDFKHIKTASKNPEINNGKDKSTLFAAFLGNDERYDFYKKEISDGLSAKKSVLLVLPTLSDVVWAKNYYARFEPVVWSSDLSKKMQSETFEKLLLNECSFVIGTRRSVFLPLNNLGTIIVDREYDYAHKDGRRPYYNTRNVALKKSERYKIRVIFGGSAFSVDIYSKIKEGGVKKLTEKPPDAYKKNHWEIVKKYKSRNYDIISILKESIDRNYIKKLTTLIHYPLKGFSGGYYCGSCKRILKCEDCDIPLTLYIAGKEKILRCNYCGRQIVYAPLCNICGSRNLTALSFGTQKIEESLRQLYPCATITRYDLDARNSYKSNKNKESLSADFIIATHPPRHYMVSSDIGLVILLNADFDFMHPEYFSNEKIFLKMADYSELLSKKAEEPELYVETHFPDYYPFKLNYEEFYSEELKQRKKLKYPPYARLITLTFRSKNDKLAKLYAEKTSTLMEKILNENNLEAEIVGPSSDYRKKLRKRYLWKIILKGNGDFSKIISAVRSSRNYSVSVSIDAESAA